MTKLTNTNELADAVNATVTALIDNGHNEHAEVVQHSIANILRNGSPITIDTLHQWLGLIDVAHCLISDAGDECTADETAEHARSYVRKEIDAINVAAGEAPINYGQLHTFNPMYWTTHCVNGGLVVVATKTTDPIDTTASNMFMIPHYRGVGK